MFTKCLKYFLAHTESLSNVIDVYKPLGGTVLNLMQGQWFAFSITIVKQEGNGKRRERKGRKREGKNWEGRREGRLVSSGTLERFASFYTGNGRRGDMSQLIPNLFYETSLPLILNPNRESKTNNNPR